MLRVSATFLLFTSLNICGSVIAQNISQSIIFNTTTSFNNKEIYGDYVYLNRSSTLQVNLAPVSKNVSFIIFQVHSHLHNVILYNNTFVRGSYVNGTNVGLYGTVKPLDTYFIWNQNKDVDLKLYISIHGYGAGDPIPGGCNMEFPVSFAPYLHTSYTADYIFVDAASAKDAHDKDCTSVTDAVVVFYQMYLPEDDFDVDNYFNGIKQMLTLDNIESNGDIIPGDVVWRMRRMLSAYPGTGTIYVAVAYSTITKAYSVYVPTYTYACSPLLEGDCELLDDIVTECLCALLIFIGLFVCYFGHKFFKTEMFLSGMMTGYLITYILISIIAGLESSVLVKASALSGLFFGAIWLVFWWFYGIPLLAVLLPTLNMGFLFSAIVYYRLPGGLPLLQVDFNFWTLFILIMVTSSLFLVSMTFVSNILCCAILGAYAVLIPIDYYIGSNLKYILINTIRRATVTKFDRAVLAPPFQWKDAVLTTVWLSLSISGFIFQHYQNRNRPPFPPPPRSISPRMPEDYAALEYHSRRDRRFIPSGITNSANERTPLLSSQPNPVRQELTQVL